MSVAMPYDSARYCYKSVGFQAVGKTEIYKMPVGEWECIEMELLLFTPMPRHEPIKKVYVEMVRNVIESEAENDEDAK